MTTTLEKIAGVWSTIKICSYCGPYTGLKLAKGKSSASLKSLSHKLEYKIATKPLGYSHVCAEGEEWTYRSWPDP
jgi:hypothetical protein